MQSYNPGIPRLFNLVHILLKCFEQNLGECKVHAREIQVSLQKKNSTLVTVEVLPVKDHRECRSVRSGALW